MSRICNSDIIVNVPSITVLPPTPLHSQMPSTRRPSIKDTDDYLTARFANPKTGLISPSLYGLSSGESGTPRTPATPGEALEIFYGEDVWEKSRRSCGTTVQELNEYYGLGKKARRPVLKRGVADRSPVVGKKVDREVLSTVSMTPPSSAGMVENITGSTTSAPQIERVASYWSKVRHRLQDSNTGDSKRTVSGQSDLSRLPSVHLVHPSQAAKPRAEQKTCQVHELEGSYPFLVKRKPPNVKTASPIKDKDEHRFTPSAWAVLVDTFSMIGAAKKTKAKSQAKGGPVRECSVTKHKRPVSKLSRSFGKVRRTIVVALLSAYGLIVAWQAMGILFDVIRLNLKVFAFATRVVFWLCRL